MELIEQVHRLSPSLIRAAPRRAGTWVSVRLPDRARNPLSDAGSNGTEVLDRPASESACYAAFG
jgi:hypothetical protein